jgi:glycosyltransferase involved in cell wall biosynthesis
VPALTKAIERIANHGLRKELEAGARRRRDDLRWEDTVADLAALLDSVVTERAADRGR